MTKAVIFDLDGVIVSTDECHYKAWKKMADEEGIYFDKEINNRLRGVSRADSLEIILERAEKEYSELEMENKADKCIKCGKCAKVCPQGIDIPGEMERILKIVEG